VNARAHRARHAGALAAALCALVSAAQAQETFGVRAGEHADYTRIVIDGPVGGDYAWGVAGRRLSVLLRAPGSGFDVAAAERAPGLSRVDAFEVGQSAAGAALTVALGCDCGARTMRLDDGRFVIDVALGAPRPAAPDIAGDVAEPDVATGSAPAAQTAAADPAAGAPNPTPTPSTAGLAAPPPPPAPRSADGVPGETPAQDPTIRADAQPSGAPSSQNAETRATAASGGDEPAAALAASRQSATEPDADAAAAQDRAEAALQPVADTADADAAHTDPAADDAAEAETETEDAETAEVAPEADAEAEAQAARKQEMIDNARRRLLEQLTRAAEEGFLTFAPDAEPPAADPDAEPTPEDPDAQVTAKTALEMTDTRENARKAPPEPNNCLPDCTVDAANWSRDAATDLQLGKSRRALVREFDSPDPRAVIAYAQMLISFGFGYEATAALDAFADAVAPPAYLLDMAAVVDGETPAADGPLRTGVGCPGLHGAWALAGAALAGDLDAAAIDAAALNDPLTRLPPRMRSVIAVPVAEAAVEAGRIETAEHVIKLAARSEPPPPDGDARLVLLAARVDAARGDWRRAEAAIDPLIDDASETGAEAMIRMVEFRLARRAAPPPGMAENMEAMAFGLGSSPLGRRLLAAAAQARARGEGLAMALSALRDLSERGAAPGAATAAARDMVVDYQPTAEESVAYAEAILDNLDMIGDGPESDRARIAAARRFTMLGVGGLAEDILAPPLSRNDPAARIAAAEAALDSRAPDRALAHLEGAAGPEAARTRALAHAAKGDYAAAAEAAATAGDVALEARYAWLAGDWRAAAAAGDADRRVLAAWMAGDGEMPPELRDAARTDPGLAARLDAFDPNADEIAAEPLEAAADALEAAKRRRALMRELIGDG
jgi:hypothetical protein